MEIDSNVYKEILIERTRLENESKPDFQEHSGMGADFVIKCNGNSDFVLNLARKVLLIINYQHENPENISLYEWKNIMPDEFIKNFAPERSLEEIANYRKRWFDLSYRRKLKEIQENPKWSLDNWLFWFQPKERIWFWWGAIIIDENHFVVSFRVIDDPFLSGALKWLFLASGACDVIEYNEFMKNF